MNNAQYKIEERTKENGTILYVPFFLQGEFGWKVINDSYSTYHEALVQIKKFISKNSPTISKVDYFPNEDELNETFETD
jgi:hypothetical protein